MIIFAFPGTGKTVLSKCYDQAVDLELSEIKFDNRLVKHLSKEERKAVPRPLSGRHYKRVYVDKAMAAHQEGKVVLVAINLIIPILKELRKKTDRKWHIFLPQMALKNEYRHRYMKRGNNQRFIGEVMLIWRPTIWFFQLMAYFFPQTISFLGSGEYLKDRLSEMKIVPALSVRAD